MIFPQLTASRELIDLSGIWDFAFGSTELEVDKLTQPLPQALPMAVPGSYNDQYEGKEFRDHYGYVYYQHQFELTYDLVYGNKRLVLRFGSVTHACVVYLNGQKIASHKGGFLPFEICLNTLEKCYAQVGLNTLALAVDNRIDFSTLPVGNESGAAMFGADLPDFPSVKQTKVAPRNYPNFDFFNYSGIHRPVKLYTTPTSFIEDVTVLTTQKEGKAYITYEITGGYTAIAQDKAQVSAQVAAQFATHDIAKAAAPTASANDMDELQCSVMVVDSQGKILGQSSGLKGCICLEQYTPWELGNGYLYSLRITYGADIYTQSFGIREVKVEGTQLLINGKPVYLKGFGKHEDSPWKGKGLDETLNVKDLSLMRWINANSLRTSHYPYAEEMLNLCDRLGVAVIDETPAVGLNFPNLKDDWYKDHARTSEHHRQVLTELIARDKNHPSVILWSLANEPDTAARAQSALEYFKPLYDLAHKLDPQNRPVTVVVCNNRYVDDLVAKMCDVICFNRYYGWYIFGGDLDAACQAMRHELEYWKEVNKPVVLTEYGADAVPGLHQSTAGMFSEEYQVEYYQRMNLLLDEYDYVVGEHPWAFADFNTIQGLYRVDGNKKGLFTRERHPKMAAHYFKKRWGHIPNYEYDKAQGYQRTLQELKEQQQQL